METDLKADRRISDPTFAPSYIGSAKLTSALAAQPHITATYLLPLHILHQLLTTYNKFQSIQSQPRAFIRDWINSTRKLGEFLDPEQERRFSKLVSSTQDGLEGLFSMMDVAEEQRSGRSVGGGSRVNELSDENRVGELDRESWKRMPEALQRMPEALQQESSAAPNALIASRSATADPYLHTLLLTLPPDQRSRGAELLQLLKTVSGTFAWVRSGELKCQGIVIPGTNFADIFSVLYKHQPNWSRSTDASTYWRDKLPRGTWNFIRSYSQTSLPVSLIRNKYIAGEIRKLRETKATLPKTVDLQGAGSVLANPKGVSWRSLWSNTPASLSYPRLFDGDAL